MTTCLWKCLVLRTLLCCVVCGGELTTFFLCELRSRDLSSFSRLHRETLLGVLLLLTPAECSPPPTPKTTLKGETVWFLLIFIVSSFIQVESCFVGILNVAKVAEHHCAKHILNVAVWRKVNSVSYSVSINMFNTFGCVLNLNIIHFQFESV